MEKTVAQKTIVEGPLVERSVNENTVVEGADNKNGKLINL